MAVACFKNKKKRLSSRFIMVHFVAAVVDLEKISADPKHHFVSVCAYKNRAKDSF